MTPLRIFIGYDSREPIAYHVLAHSILRRSSIPVSITPLVRSQLLVYTRPKGRLESTDFSLTRFLVPYLCGYEGHAIYLDCDMLCLADIDELPTLDARAVWVARHDYVPKTTTKFLGQEQTVYPRKNWSSVMAFANARCRALTPAYVNAASPAELHRFQWVDDQLIGELPLEWNWLVGEYEPNPKAKILHYTLGGPWFDDYRRCDHAEEWFAERDHMLMPTQRPRTLADLPNRSGRG